MWYVVFFILMMFAICMGDIIFYVLWGLYVVGTIVFFVNSYFDNKYSVAFVDIIGHLNRSRLVREIVICLKEAKGFYLIDIGSEGVKIITSSKQQLYYDYQKHNFNIASDGSRIIIAKMIKHRCGGKLEIIEKQTYVKPNGDYKIVDNDGGLTYSYLSKCVIYSKEAVRDNKEKIKIENKKKQEYRRKRI